MLTKFNFNSSLDRSLFLPFRFPSDPNIQINVQKPKKPRKPRKKTAKRIEKDRRRANM